MERSGARAGRPAHVALQARPGRGHPCRHASRRHAVNARLALLLCLLGGLLAAPGRSWAQGADAGLTPDEFRLALLAKVPPYVTWPKQALSGSDAPLVLAVLGGDPFQGLLEKLVEELRFEGRRVVVRQVDRLEDLGTAHVLYVPAARSDDLRQLDAARREGLLTIGEGARFLDLGGVLSLEPAERRVDVSLKNARAAGLRISSQLLRIARVVDR